MSLIESRALLSYFAPYGSVSLPKMAEAFGLDESALHRAVLNLIRTGHMKARIDSRAGVLVAKKKDVRADAFKHAFEEGAEIQRKSKGLALRFVFHLFISTLGKQH